VSQLSLQHNAPPNVNFFFNDAIDKQTAGARNARKAMEEEEDDDDDDFYDRTNDRKRKEQVCSAGYPFPSNAS
jgi:hypothetical protein